MILPHDSAANDLRACRLSNCKRSIIHLTTIYNDATCFNADVSRLPISNVGLASNEIKDRTALKLQTSCDNDTGTGRNVKQRCSFQGQKSLGNGLVSLRDS